MNENLVCRCGVLTHRIFVHDENNKNGINQDITTSAINAVKDYMVDDISKGENSVGYKWRRSDGKVVSLVCIVEDAKEEM